MKETSNLIQGKIYKTLVRFALPIILTLFLQSLYGAVDLLVVGQFATTADVSGVSTGSMIMHSITMVMSGQAMSVTALVGNRIGENRPKDAGKAIGAGLCLFTALTIILMAVLIPLSPVLARLMKAPQEAFSQTVSYLRICFSGFCFVIAYNILGGIFRGIGDSITPLITVSISCVLNIICDILFVAVFHMGASGAAYATIMSQAVSVLTSFLFIRKKQLPIKFNIKEDLHFDSLIIKTEIKIGAPIAISELLVGLSFMVIQALANNISLVSSAGIGVGEKVCGFIMLIPSAFSQSMTAFVAQNIGADKPERAKKALLYGILTSACFGVIMFYIAFFHGNLLAQIFDNSPDVIVAAHSYLKAYAIDCMLTPFLFCMLGYFNGYGKTTFVMFQGIFSAFCIRTPLAIIFSKLPNSSLFLIGLSTPCASTIQILMGLLMLVHIENQRKKGLLKAHL